MVARRAHNPKVTGSNPVPATNNNAGFGVSPKPLFISGVTGPPPSVVPVIAMRDIRFPILFIGDPGGAV